MRTELPPKSDWVLADFNGMLEEDLVCLSHSNTARTFDGRQIELVPGLRLTAYDEDTDDNGKRDDIFVSGVIERSPQEAQCRGSRWSLRFDQNGIRHESDLQA